MQPFKFKQFDVYQDKAIFMVNQDGVLLAAWADVENKKAGLDIGTGTGVIALACCQRNKQITIDAVEVDEETAAQAKNNFQISKFSERLRAHCSTVQAFALSTEKKYDLIISNPPYFQVGKNQPTKTRLQTAKHTDLLSFEDLVDTSVNLMKVEGIFHLILPFQEAKEFIEIAKKKNLFLSKRTFVKGRAEKPIERVLMSFSRTEEEILETNLVVQKSGVRHDYTKEYVDLVKEFYTIL